MEGEYYLNVLFGLQEDGPLARGLQAAVSVSC